MVGFRLFPVFVNSPFRFFLFCVLSIRLIRWWMCVEIYLRAHTWFKQVRYIWLRSKGELTCGCQWTIEHPHATQSKCISDNGSGLASGTQRTRNTSTHTHTHSSHPLQHYSECMELNDILVSNRRKRIHKSKWISKRGKSAANKFGGTYKSHKCA